MNKRSMCESVDTCGVQADLVVRVPTPGPWGKRGRLGTYMQACDYEATMVHDPTAAPEKQAKVALDELITRGDVSGLQALIQQVGSQFQQFAEVLIMHGLRTAGKEGHQPVMHFLLKQIEACPPQQLLEFLKYAIDGAATREDDAGGMMDFLLRMIGAVFKVKYPHEFQTLVQYAVNSAASHGNLRLLKYLIDQTFTASLTIDYGIAFTESAERGHAEELLKDAIRWGAQCENVLLMMLQWMKNLPLSNDSGLGCRHSLKAAAKYQILKSYKQSNPELCARLMSVVRDL